MEFGSSEGSEELATAGLREGTLCSSIVRGSKK